LEHKKNLKEKSFFKNVKILPQNFLIIFFPRKRPKMSRQIFKNVHITYADEKSINFDKSILTIPEGVFKTIYMSKFVAKMKDGKPTEELMKNNDIVNIDLKIGPKFINVMGYNIIGHKELESEFIEYDFSKLI